MPDSDFLQAQREQARSHPFRRGILALIARDRDRSTEAQDIQRELPDDPPLPMVEYHLSVLRRVGLLASRANS